MTNGEFYRTTILDIIKDYPNLEGIPVGLKNGMPILCNSIGCGECDLEHPSFCTVKLIEWLFEEYKTPLVLTYRQRLFCELMKSGYIVRNLTGDLHYFSNEPVRDEQNYWNSEISDPHEFIVSTSLVEFPFMLLEIKRLNKILIEIN